MALPDEHTLKFAYEHRFDDVKLLALQSARHTDVDMPAAMEQISGWQVARHKIPSWAGNEGIIYAPHLSMEQCSSEATARYKRTVIEACTGGHQVMADLTGGFGIDCAFMAPAFGKVTYVEKDRLLCEIARHNFRQTGIGYIKVVNDSCTGYLGKGGEADWLFLDPARRNGHGGKVVAMADSEPDVTSLEDTLLKKAPHVLLKLSPMLDIHLAVNTLKHVAEAHVVSVENECKELLLVLQRDGALPPDDVPIHCAMLASGMGRHIKPILSFTRRSEREALCTYASRPLAYLYEPDAAVLKAGAFRSVAHIYNVYKLHPNSHLYTSEQHVVNFPGRTFRVDDCLGFSKKELRRLSGLERANISTRNFPTSAAALRSRLKLAEGGNTYIFATTLANGKKVLLRTSKP